MASRSTEGKPKAGSTKKNKERCRDAAMPRCSAEYSTSSSFFFRFFFFLSFSFFFSLFFSIPFCYFFYSAELRWLKLCGYFKAMWLLNWGSCGYFLQLLLFLGIFFFTFFSISYFIDHSLSQFRPDSSFIILLWGSSSLLFMILSPRSAGQRTRPPRSTQVEPFVKATRLCSRPRSLERATLVPQLHAILA